MITDQNKPGPNATTANLLPFRPTIPVIRSKVERMTEVLTLKFSTGETLNIKYCPNKFSYSKYVALRGSLEQIEYKRTQVEKLRLELKRAAKALSDSAAILNSDMGTEEGLKAIEAARSQDITLLLAPAQSGVEETEALAIHTGPLAEPEGVLAIRAEIEQTQNEAIAKRAQAEVAHEAAAAKVSEIESRIAELSTSMGDQTGILIGWLADFMDSWDMRDYKYKDEGQTEIEVEMVQARDEATGELLWADAAKTQAQMVEQPILIPVPIDVPTLEALGMPILTPIITALLDKLTVGKGSGGNSGKALLVVEVVEANQLGS